VRLDSHFHTHPEFLRLQKVLLALQPPDPSRAWLSNTGGSARRRPTSA